LGQSHSTGPGEGIDRHFWSIAESGDMPLPFALDLAKRLQETLADISDLTVESFFRSFFAAPDSVHLLVSTPIDSAGA
jgi:hypothetical protein